MTNKEYVSQLLNDIDAAVDADDLELANSLLPDAQRAVVDLVTTEMSLNGNKEPKDVAAVHSRFIELKTHVESEIENQLTRSR
jgi:hypothetical protein